MKNVLAIAIILVLAAGCTERTRPGRAALVHFNDGRTLKCVVLDCSGARLHIIDDAGKKRSLDIGSVQKVVFAEAVGELVRDPFDPPGAHDPAAAPAGHEPTTAPAGAERTDGGRRSLEELSSVAPRYVIGVLWSMTGGLQDVDRAAKLEKEIEPKLKAAHEQGKVRDEKNLRLSLVILKLVQQQYGPAKELLDALKRDHSDDLVLQDLTIERLSRSIARWHGLEPGRFPRRPPRERPDLPREAPPPPPEPRP